MPLLGLFAPYLLGALRELKPRPRGRVTEDAFSDAAYRALAARGPAPATVLYAVYGHNHTQDAQWIPARGGTPDVMYLNAGTWTALFIEDRPDLQGRALRPFLCFTLGSGGEYAHEFLQWNDDRGLPEPIEILGPVRRSGWVSAAATGSSGPPPQPAGAGDAEPVVGP